jgi:SAM-dependent methyltransferase
MCTEEDLESQFTRRGPWITQFEIEGKTYGGERRYFTDKRVHYFFEHFPDASTILELGCLEGGHSLALASRPGVEHVTAVDGRPDNIDRANFVKDKLGVRTVEFVLADLNLADLASLGRFDAIFCCGLLYHLSEPWRLVRQMSVVAPALFLWTHYALEEEAAQTVEGFRVKLYREGDLAHPFSGFQLDSPWLTLGSLINLLTGCGYKSIHLIENDLEMVNGPAVTIAARKKG